jgi:hypothetical protein
LLLLMLLMLLMLLLQIHSMIQKLAQFTDIDAALIVGGLSLPAQAAALRSGPAIVVATPGRIIDHVSRPSPQWVAAFIFLQAFPQDWCFLHSYFASCCFFRGNAVC